MEYLPNIRQKVLDLLIDKCLELDVNIFIKDNGDAIIDEEEKNKVTREENDDTTTLDGRKIYKEDTIEVLSDKLDALLELLFQLIQFRAQKM